jgi:hypothetical protein
MDKMMLKVFVVLNSNDKYLGIVQADNIELATKRFFVHHFYICNTPLNKNSINNTYNVEVIFPDDTYNIHSYKFIKDYLNLEGL